MDKEEFSFQVNLQGVIDILSNHIYSSPEVYVRELLQNAADAVGVREKQGEPDFRAETVIEVIAGDLPTLMIADNGVGLDMEEVKTFLSTVGLSSKSASGREEADERESEDFIGRFGIGLLSCFAVSDEIRVITRSAREGASPLEWVGGSDGRCTVRVLENDILPGTRVYLRARAGMEKYFDPDFVLDLARKYGGLLPYPLYFQEGSRAAQVNVETPPWRRSFPGEDERRYALLEYGREAFQTEFFDCIPIFSPQGDVEGAAYILPWSPSPAARPVHRVYLKNMFLKEGDVNILPEWAFFTRLIINSNELRPTASRESLYEDEALLETRRSLGEILRQYLVRLASSSPERLGAFISLHHLSLKALAAQDPEFYRIIIDWLPFETSQGRIAIGEYRKKHKTLQFVSSLDEFRQIAPVAAAQSIPVFNAGYVYDRELLSLLPSAFEDMNIKLIDAEILARNFEDLNDDERRDAARFMKIAIDALEPFHCLAEIKKFLPGELPALYSQDRNFAYMRSLEKSREQSGELWSSILDSFTEPVGRARLCFNFNNPLVKRALGAGDDRFLKKTAELLYVQSLLLGHHPLGSREMELLTEGFSSFLEWGLSAESRHTGS